MTQSNTTRKGSDGKRLPSVQPDKVRKATLDSEQLAVANEFFASLDPDQIVVPKIKEPVAAAAAPQMTAPVADGEIVAELDTPREEIWEDSLSEALGPQLQQALPAPASRPVAKKKGDCETERDCKTEGDCETGFGSDGQASKTTTWDPNSRT